MKINEETTISEEQVLFNKLSYEDQQFILKQMRMLQPCELSCEIEEEKKILEKLDYCEENTFMKQKETTYLSQKERILLDSNFKAICNKINAIIDYLKSKGE